MYPCLEMQVYCFCVGILHSSASPDKDTPLTGSCYNPSIAGIFKSLRLIQRIVKLTELKKKEN